MKNLKKNKNIFSGNVLNVLLLFNCHFTAMVAEFGVNTSRKKMIWRQKQTETHTLKT